MNTVASNIGRGALVLLVAALTGILASGCTASSSAGIGIPSGCSTQQVGGDSVAPVCSSPTPAPNQPVNPPVVEAGSPPPPSGSDSGLVPPPALSGSAAPPVVTSVKPASGSAAGGASVTIEGIGFTGATEVDFGGATADMNVVSDTEIDATSPTGSGTVDVTVVTPDGTSATTQADQFTYQS